MRVHHLNCGSMDPIGPSLVCHVLLAETSDGLLLVDTGFGLRDVADPSRLGPFRHVIRPRLLEHETALRQIQALGCAASDVRHVVLTHLDLDHAGGLADFPSAAVHVTAAEARGAVHAPSLRERLRYRPVQWAHGVRWVEHEPAGEAWRGFAAAEELLPGVALVPLGGHSRGHLAVAVDADDGTWLHAGDAFYDHATLTGGRAPQPLHAMEATVAWDRRLVRANQARLAELHARGEPDLTIVCAHDPALLPT